MLDLENGHGSSSLLFDGVLAGVRLVVAVAVLRFGVLGTFEVDGPASAFSVRGRLFEFAFVGEGFLVDGADGFGVGLTFPRAFDN